MQKQNEIKKLDNKWNSILDKEEFIPIKEL